MKKMIVGLFSAAILALFTLGAEANSYDAWLITSTGMLVLFAIQMIVLSNEEAT